MSLSASPGFLIRSAWFTVNVAVIVSKSRTQLLCAEQLKSLAGQLLDLCDDLCWDDDYDNKTPGCVGLG